MRCTHCHGRLFEERDSKFSFSRMVCLSCGRARYVSLDGHDLSTEIEEAAKHRRPCRICGEFVMSGRQSRSIYCSACRQNGRRRMVVLTERLLPT